MAFDPTTTAGRGLARQLTEVCLAGAQAERASASPAIPPAAWRELTDLAVAWKVTPQLVERLDPNQSAEAAATLRRAFLGAFGRTQRVAARTLAAMAALESAGIRVAAFKGLASIAFLYRDPRLRSIHDADLIVEPGQVDAALECLERIGFRRKGEETLAEYENFVAHSPGFAGNRAIALTDAQDVELDLHWELTGAGTGAREILGRAVRAPLLNASANFAHPTDCFLLTVHHSIRENLAAEGIIRDLLDVQRWCAYFAEHRQLQEAAAHANSKQLTAGVLALLEVLARHGSTASVVEARGIFLESATPADRRAAERLAELFELQLDHGRIERDVFYLVHAKPGAQVVRGLWKDWSGYRKSMNNMDAQLERNGSLPGRLKSLARVLPHWRQLRMLRELARLKYRGGSAL